jgi:membrane protein DedA with SNARE-associated domain
MLLGSPTKEKLKRKAPLIITIAIAIALVTYILFEIIEDLVVEGVPLTSGPLIGGIFHFLDSVTATVYSWGYSAVFGLMLLEASSLPIPSEVVLPFAGYLISLPMSQLNFYLTVAVATIAAIIGSLIDYYIGLKGVQALLKYRLLGRAILNESQLKVAAGWFTKYGAVMVFLGRLIPGFRTLISFPAGAVKMPLAKFLAYTTAGCILWNSLLIYVGYYLGTNWAEVAGISHYLIIATVGALLTTAIIYLIVRRNKRKKGQQNAVQPKSS